MKEKMFSHFIKLKPLLFKDHTADRTFLQVHHVLKTAVWQTFCNIARRLESASDNHLACSTYVLCIAGFLPLCSTLHPPLTTIVKGQETMPAIRQRGYPSTHPLLREKTKPQTNSVEILTKVTVCVSR